MIKKWPRWGMALAVAGCAQKPTLNSEEEFVEVNTTAVACAVHEHPCEVPSAQLPNTPGATVQSVTFDFPKRMALFAFGGSGTLPPSMSDKPVLDALWITVKEGALVSELNGLLQRLGARVIEMRAGSARLKIHFKKVASAKDLEVIAGRIASRPFISSVEKIPAQRVHRPKGAAANSRSGS